MEGRNRFIDYLNENTKGFNEALQNKLLEVILLIDNFTFIQDIFLHNRMLFNLLHQLLINRIRYTDELIDVNLFFFC